MPEKKHAFGFGAGTLIHDEGRGVYGIILSIDGVTPAWGSIDATVFILAVAPDSEYTAGAIEEEFFLDDETQVASWPKIVEQIRATQ